MVKYEYDRVSVKYKTVKDLKESLNELGSKGWEIVNYNENESKRYSSKDEVTVLVKRPVNDNKLGGKQIL